MITPRNAEFPKLVGGLPTFFGAYLQYKEACAEEGRSWNINTQEEYESFLIKLFIPNLKRHNTVPICSLRLDDYISALKKIEKEGWGSDPNSHVPYEQSTLSKHLHIVQTVVTVVAEREHFPNVFEDTSQEQPGKANSIDKMRNLWMIPKSLTPAQEHRVADYILKHVRDKDGVSIALLLMFALGLRNQEACGANFGFIHEMLDYPGSYYLTVPQTTAIGTNETKIGGKSYNSGRNIPLPSDLVSILFELRDKRLLMLRKRGLEDVRTIDDIPVAHRKSDPFARCGADEVTRAAKKMFDELGMRNGIHDLGQYLQQDIASASEEADVEEFALIEKEPTGYLLRRNFATHLAILGLADSSQIEYLLGHVVTEAQTERSSYLDERALYAIKLRLDARPLLNPIARAPQIQLKGNTITSINRYSQEVLVPGNASRVYISATAKEPGDSINITVTLPDEAQVYEDIMIRSMPFPLDFPRAADVTKAYHEAYARGKESTSHT